MAFVRNQFYNANILIENGNETLPKELEYSRTLNNLKIKHSGSHYLGVSIYEEYLRELLQRKKPGSILKHKVGI
ncbi:MAG: hypothetical protein U5K54_27075 [Cytophagales bacterium]|nr:hypothetical protein [Cytophagales bacterium]